jgi:LAO/AO transport system kinase
VLAGDVAVLGRAITLAESSKGADQVIARQVLDLVLPNTGKSFRIGITGVPGAGKSTFIERFGSLVVEKGSRLAVLAIDPSSSRSKGSILGDKTRMTALAGNPDVYIRPSPSGGSLGGITGTTFAAILLCEAAGYDFVIVETVGVGQSEIAVSRVTDFFLLLLLAGAGDELQGIKRGIMELADAVVITKADGANAEKARKTRGEFGRALHMLQPLPSGWTAPALTCSAFENKGIEEIYGMMLQFRQQVTDNGYLQRNRKQQFVDVLRGIMNSELLRIMYHKHGVEKYLRQFDEASLAEPFTKLGRLISSVGA